MDVHEIRTLVAFNDWANGRFDDVLAGLTEEQLTCQLTSSFPSILETQAHIVGAEWLWLKRWQGNSPGSLPSWWPGAHLATLRQQLRLIEQERSTLLLSLDETALAAPLAYRNLAGKPFTRRLGDLIRHVVNHSTYHRGQLTTLLRQVGAEPPRTDLVTFLPEAR